MAAKYVRAIVQRLLITVSSGLISFGIKSDAVAGIRRRAPDADSGRAAARVAAQVIDASEMTPNSSVIAMKTVLDRHIWELATLRVVVPLALASCILSVLVGATQLASTQPIEDSLSLRAGILEFEARSFACTVAKRIDVSDQPLAAQAAIAENDFEIIHFTELNTRYRVSTGWPLRTTACNAVMMRGMDSDGTTYEWLHSTLSEGGIDLPWFHGARIVLPFTPVWWGGILNCGAYIVFWFVVLGMPQFVVRAWRKRCAQCEFCGYPARGWIENICPECGNTSRRA